MEFLAHLGPNAFEEIYGEVVSSALFTLVNKKTDSTNVIAYRAIGEPSPLHKAKALLKSDTSNDLVFTIGQGDILGLPQSPIAYWLGPNAVRLMKGTVLNEIANIIQQVITSDNPRFLRFLWETPPSARWQGYLKADGYKKWAGLEQYKVEWECEGSRIKNRIVEKYDYLEGNWIWLLKTESIGLPSLTYSLMASGSLGIRRVSDGMFCDTVSPTIVLSKH